MLDDSKTQITAKIPTELHNRLLEAVNSKKFENKTDCITKGLEIILSNTHQESPPDVTVLQEMKNEIQNLQSELQKNYSKINELQSVIESLPDPLELIEVRARLEGMQALIEEKDARIHDPTREAETLNAFAQYFKSSEMKQIEGQKRKWWKRW